jgi:glycosyltransferase involved in cell wall biosynthesis
MRVLFAQSLPYPPQRYSGADVTVHELCLALRARGVACGVLAAAAARARRADGAGLGGDYPIFRHARPEQGVGEAVARFAPSIAVVQAGAAPALAEAFVARGLPTLLYVHDVAFERWGGIPRPHPRLAWLANSRFTAARLRERLGVQAELLRPLVTPERYRVDTRRERVLFVNPHPFKGADVALHLAERRPDVAFDFAESWRAGRGPARRWRARAERLSNLTWHGAAPDVRPFLARARLVLVPSRWEETWGRVATEAQVSGIPVLGAGVGGLPEAVGPGGLLVDPDADLAGWERAFARLWDDPQAYARCARAAAAHAARAEIQPEAVAANFLARARRHADGAEPRPVAG